MLERFGLVQTNIKAVKVGDVFDRLKVLAVGQIANTYKYYAVCQCSCGSELKRIRTDGLINGNVVGCGCVRNERTTTHGLTNHKHFKRWSHIMDRCYNERTKSYKDYGGRGISVCDAWHDVTTFINDLPDGYQPGMQIDRIDNNGNYEPGNVKWSTRKQQCANKRSNRYFELNGETKIMAEWAADIGVKHSVISDRIASGWPIDKALTVRPGEWTTRTRKPKPEKRPLKTVEWQGVNYTVAELSETTGVSKELLRKQLFERNWPIDKVMQRAGYSG